MKRVIVDSCRFAYYFFFEFLDTKMGKVRKTECLIAFYYVNFVYPYLGFIRVILIMFDRILK